MLNAEFLLTNKTGARLYENIKDLPIIDYHNHLSVKDIAENLGMSESSVKTRLSRVRNELRTYLTERGVEV